MPFINRHTFFVYHKALALPLLNHPRDERICTYYSDFASPIPHKKEAVSSRQPPHIRNQLLQYFTVYNPGFVSG